MKRLTLLVGLVCMGLSNSLCGQIREEWMLKIPAPVQTCSAALVGVAGDDHGNCYVGYLSTDSVSRLNIKKIDATGVPVWSWSVTGYDAYLCGTGGALQMAPDGNLVAGFGSSANFGYNTFKFDSLGNVLWHHRLDSGITRSTAFGPFFDRQGNAVLVSSEAGGSHLYFHKLSPAGQLLTNGAMLLSGGASFCRFSNYNGDSICFYGDFNIPNGPSLISIANFDSVGNQRDIMTYTGYSTGYGYELAHDTRPYFASIFPPGIKLWKFGHHGEFYWSKYFVGPTATACNQINVEPQTGNVYIMGGTVANGVYIAKADSAGNHFWTKTFTIPNTGAETLIAIRTVSSSRLAVVGYGQGFNSMDVPWVALVDTAGNLLDYVINPSLSGYSPYAEVTKLDALGNLWIFFQSYSQTNQAEFRLWKICLGECGSNVSGHVWYDNNADCVQNANDPVYQWVPIRLQPSNTYSLTDENGKWQRQVAPGTWSASTPLTFPWFNACGPLQQSFTNPGSPTWYKDSVDFAMHSSIQIQDLRLDLLPSVARVGQNQHVHLYCTNLGTTPTTPTIYFVADTAFPLLSATPPPTTVSGDTLIWSFGTLYPYQLDTVLVELSVPTTAQIGNTYLHWAKVEPIPGDIQPSNNVESFGWFIRGAFDPNEKIVSPGGVLGRIAPEIHDLSYLVTFQNTGNDTAWNIIVRDTISPALFDLGTFHMGPASHAFNLNLSQDSVFTWIFHDILLPDSNVNEPRSHGFLRYSITRRQLGNSSIAYCNQASIYFDYNLPVLTNNSCVQEDQGLSLAGSATPIDFRIVPNPSNGDFSINLPNARGLACDITVFDLAGQSILQAQTHPENGQIPLHLEHLPSGIYIVRAKVLKQSYFGRVILAR